MKIRKMAKKMFVVMLVLAMIYPNIIYAETMGDIYQEALILTEETNDSYKLSDGKKETDSIDVQTKNGTLELENEIDSYIGTAERSEDQSMNDEQDEADLEVYGLNETEMVSTDGDGSYTFETKDDGNGGLIITGYEGWSFDGLIIPKIIDGKTVTRIGDLAFNDCYFRGELILPNSITTIGYDAFCGCSGFTGELILPNSVTAIGDGAFYGCTGFTGLTIPNSITTIGKSVFSDCSGFAGDLTIPDNITTIGHYAFYGCSGFTGKLTIPGSVTTMDTKHFLIVPGLQN